MKYGIIGAGGTGGAIAAYLDAAGKDVTLFARGENLRALMEHGLIFHNVGETSVHREVDGPNGLHFGDSTENPTDFGRFDVVFICVKSYSLPEIAPLAEGIADEETIFLPILNGINAGELVRRSIRKGIVLDGLVYIYAAKTGQGEITKGEEIFRIIFGTQNGEVYRNGLSEPLRDELRDRFHKIEEDLKQTGIDALFTEEILKETIRKFSFVSCVSAVGLYYGNPTGYAKRPGKERDFFIGAVREIFEIADAVGVTYEEDMVQHNLDFLDGVLDDSTTSLQRDIAAGGRSEFDLFVLEPIRIGKRYGLPMKHYRMLAEKFGQDVSE